jgi:hypothetical protein
VQVDTVAKRLEGSRDEWEVGIMHDYLAGHNACSVGLDVVSVGA